MIDRAEIQRRLEDFDQDELEEDEQKLRQLFEKGQELLEDGKDPGSLEGWIFENRGLD